MDNTSYVKSFFGLLFNKKVESEDALKKDLKDKLTTSSFQSAIKDYESKRASPPRGLKELKNANTNK